MQDPAICQADGIARVCEHDETYGIAEPILPAGRPQTGKMKSGGDSQAKGGGSVSSYIDTLISELAGG